MSSNHNFIVIVGVISNILSVVGVVICNKYIIEVDKFHYSVFLSFLHFAFTALGTRVMLFGNYFTYNTAPLSGILPVAIGSLMSVAFMNMNLAYNSVGFYQLSKLACIPFTLLVQYLMYNQTVSTSVQLTLIPISFGVGYATVYDVSLNLFGLSKPTHTPPCSFSFLSSLSPFSFVVIAVFAVIATAMAQIFTNTYQKSLACDALQLLYHTSPYIALGMLLMCPLFDDVSSLAQYQYTTPCVMRIGNSTPSPFSSFAFLIRFPSFSALLFLRPRSEHFELFSLRKNLTFNLPGKLNSFLSIPCGSLI